MNKVIMVLFILLGTSVAQAEDYREIEPRSIWFMSSSDCEKQANQLVEIIQYHSNDGGSLIVSNTCKWDSSRRDDYSYRLDSTIRTNLKRGSYSLGDYCASDRFIDSYRRSLAMLSNKEAQIFIVDNSAKEVCADEWLKNITVKINLL